ncbi:TetR/AcrR family transcriptional regulator [Mycolicibacterium diernhoferi]|uniref:TetR family transcriptional regulator n=1 Tax=Mycolicibacterium diernhoferi TaxID=1801 RepID=A0A1Q4H4M1_9MYCO|nr:TetR/AcrR family transcriptional regulator [Mycolicibacterium diernhoferi]OJZ62500.1 TetR family transcriptional regulator [Mycolicibacterium diernhoferi]OPE49829.1 TetR family transcriptional regulator [Mycolicibacterium diernhoferi]PEG52190.1 TetR/AcrR family transcriptional regulator [Mycolicibacterium diernhoferi]QYL21986.1 TetR/AcrR family transcriptional regulator [Mycolicibacterium diernhoferi]
MSRAEAAAATRRALLDEAAALLDAGGPAAVTLREVGARVGVSRGAPYGHFADKETLLAAVAAEGWQRIGDEMQRLRGDSGLSPEQTLRAALLIVIAVSRERPHLYQLMFSRPLRDPGAIVRAAQRTCDEFLGIVAAVTGEDEASRHAAVLLTAAHGAAGLENSGLLDTDKWQTTADELIDLLLATTVRG